MCVSVSDVLSRWSSMARLRKGSVVRDLMTNFETLSRIVSTETGACRQELVERRRARRRTAFCTVGRLVSNGKDLGIEPFSSIKLKRDGNNTQYKLSQRTTAQLIA